MADKKISALTAASTPLAGTEVLPIVQSGATVKVSVDNLTAGKTVPANAVIVGGGSLSSWGSNSPVEVGTYGTALSEQSSGSGLLVWNLYQNSGGNFVYKTSNPGLLHQLGNDGVYRWYTAPSGTAGNTASITLRASLGLTSGDYTLSTGNLIQGTAAKGVNFTANTGAAGMTSQLLNWYEEGTFTPTITGSNTGITLTYTTQTGKYFRIGKLVTVMAYVKVDTVTVAGSGFLILNTSLWNSDGSPAVGSVSFGKVTYSSYATSQMRGSGSSSIVFVNSSTIGAPSSVNATDVVSGSEMYATITYATT
jgi:hypothetical protein